MNYIAEKNQRRSRTQALVLAVTLHIALGFMLYLQTSEKPSASSDAPLKAKTEKTRTLPQSRP